ncbi:hypothetical protein TREVI0001_0915 [Treponema vincentii ATCC 35580]|uniref:Putative Se/S carrier protein-like domain-containing protein n=1 Tax=Treponema vincentii ATCC 35580 TaxID=596324 RepID=C8PR45_9SPIR|nr:DUF3343 domain-containing protein [Treponema vincentii]EEV20149.1 hypothetical protein TREVI0001_0915 [Treponema vincentii ATCC 35580]
MQNEVFCVISFDSTHQAIAAEMAVTGLPDARLIPLPPEISEGCGMALRVNREDAEKAVELLHTSGAAYQDVYTLTVQGAVRTAVKMAANDN